ncbi:MAG: hypothetical protein MZV49_18545 [Rhodopseudomonas palustris]|nr:hypothetical protein [Rhodopseudomonas palustris]
MELIPASAAAWAAIRDVDPFAAGWSGALWPIWRIVCLRRRAARWPDAGAR